MTDIMAVVLDGIAQIEYDRGAPLPERQQNYLDKLDRDMDQGFSLGGVRLDRPDPLQRAQLMCMNLIRAIQTNDEQGAAAACTYLAVRLPELRQVRAQSQGDELHIDLVFDREYWNQISVDFTFPGNHGQKPH